MCIKFLNANSSVKYDSSKSLEEQLKNSQKVVISYEPQDPDMDVFLQEMEKLAKNGVTCNVSFNLSHNNNIAGAKAKKQISRIKKDLNLNEAIKALVNIHSELDKRLESISVFCRER